MVKTLSAHLTSKNSKYPPQNSQPKLPTLKVKTLSAHLNGQNPKCHTLKVKTLSAHLKGQNPKWPSQWSKL